MCVCVCVCVCVYIYIYIIVYIIRASLVAQMVKNLPAVQKTQACSLGWEEPLEKGMATTPVFLPGKSHRQRIWWAIAHGVTKSHTRLSNTIMYICMTVSCISIYVAVLGGGWQTGDIYTL